MRLRNDSKALNKLEDSGYLETNFPIKIDYNTIIEIGMGKGEMITAMAKEHPELQFIGLEKYETVAAKAAKRAKDLELKNLKIVCQDAIKLNEIFSGACNTLWLTFSDPWPKKRHYKRRLTYKTYLDLYKNIMDENSTLKFKSDNDKLYEFSLESFNENNWKIVDFGTDLHSSIHAKNNYQTGYEQKWSLLGKNINFIFAKK